MIRSFSVSFTFAVLAALPLQAQVTLPNSFGQLPDGFFEAFALAEDRGQTLEALLAGTDEHFYFSSLHLQQQGDLDGVDKLMRPWRKAHGENGHYKQIEIRQALLRASTDPEQTYGFLERELGFGLNDRRIVPGQSPNAPTVLDQNSFSTERMLQRILSRKGTGGLQSMDPVLVETLVRRKLSDRQRSWVLDHLARPDVPGLLELVVADLASHRSHTFGNRAIHAKLTLAQLEGLRAARPEVLANQAYVDQVMRRLAPRFPESMDRRADHLAYLERTWAFVELLPSSFVSLKVHLLYHWIVFDLDGGQFNEERLMSYLRLPRAARFYVRPRKSRESQARLHEAYQGQTPFGAIGSEEAVITECLHEVFRRETNYQRFVGLLEESYVKTTFAEARLLYGEEAESEAQVRALGVARAETLRDRVDIQFARTNARDFEANEAVTLQVDIKNVDRLFVKIFQIDPVAYFDRFGKPVQSNLDLDGLVPNDQETLEYGTPSMRRVRRSIQLDALTKPGTYVVELIGAGVSSRAVVVKGSLQLLERQGPAGHLLRVLGDSGDLVDDAIVRFGGRDYTPDEAGVIRVPFSPQGAKKSVLLRRGDVTSVAKFDHSAEIYGLDAAIHTPLEGLLAGLEATVIVRPALTLNGRRIPLGILEDASLVISATTKDGVQSQTVVDGIEFDERGDVVKTITVPERVASVRVEFRARIRSVSQGKDVDLVAEAASFPVNSEHSELPFRSFLTQTPDGYAVDLLGRAGEPLVDAEVRVNVHNRLVGASANQRLKTDARGRVKLGALTDVSTLGISGPSGARNAWNLDRMGALGLPGRLHGDVGQALRVPYSVLGETVTRADASLISVGSGKQPLADHFGAMSSAMGYLVIEGLGEGDYDLTLERYDRRVRITILEGETQFRHIVGADHALDTVDSLPLQIVQVAKDDGHLNVRLGGVTQSTRVHVIATRYIEPQSGLSGVALPSDAGPSLTGFGGLFSTYESGREISDEYRYILDRRLLDPLPGNMLTRPGYLLNPWALQELEVNSAADGSHGARFGGKRNMGVGGGAGGSYGGRLGQAPKASAFAAPNFLSSGAVVLTALQPDNKGIVRIPIDSLGNKHIVQIIAMDDAVSVAQLLVREEYPLDLRERRLVDALDPASPMTQQRRIEFLKSGEAFVIRDAPNAGAKTFGSLGDVFELFRTSGAGGDELAKFEFLTRWPSLTEEEKRTNYSEFACHEVHAFLKERDPEFFQALVVPHLASKGHATFMDDWLLDRDLSEYLEPWRFETLNIVEAILLLRATGGDAAAVAQDMLGLLPPSAFSLDRTFGDILASRGLEGGQSSLGARLKESRAVARKDKLAVLGYSGDPASAPAPAEQKSTWSRSSSSDDFFLGRGEGDTKPGAAAISKSEIDGLAELEDSMEEVEVAVGFEIEERKKAEGFYFRALDQTKEYAETHYWQRRLQAMNKGLVTVSPFWADFAAAGTGPFASTAFPLANRSVNEKLLALAFLDLPFDGTEADVTVDGRSVTLSAASPMFLALEDIAPAKASDGGTTVLVGQDFFDPDQRSTVTGGVSRDRFVTGEFLKGVPYGCRMVVTNPSSSSIEMQLLVQIPEGAIALGASHMTKGLPIELASYGTASVESFFYFPKSGTYRDYPVHAGQGGTLLGAADPETLNVVDELTEVDTSTWSWISQNADVPALLDYLRGANVRSLDLDQIAWRMTEPESFTAITNALAGRSVYSESLWKYAIKHRDDARTQELLSASHRATGRVGAPFASPLLTLDVRDRGFYEHLAYEPLVTGRSHDFAGDKRILNEQLQQQYDRFLGTLVVGGKPSDDDRMELVYYLLLQNRVDEALELFGAIDGTKVKTPMQYDYMSAYMAFYRSDVATARALAEGYRDYPVDLWRSRFRDVLAQADEIEGVAGAGLGPDPDDRDQSQGALAGDEPLLALEVDGGQVRLDVEAIDEVEIRYHRMDVEFLFSNSPFVRGGQGAFGVIRPSRVDHVTIPKGQSSLVVHLPNDLRTANVVVEVRGGGISRQATYFAGDLVVQGIERYGQIRVLDAPGGKPLPKAYVKVYAQLANGQTRFHKDGYTDLRGRFDYVSLSSNAGPQVTGYSLLVMHADAGASMLELTPPR